MTSLDVEQLLACISANQVAEASFHAFQTDTLPLFTSPAPAETGSIQCSHQDLQTPTAVDAEYIQLKEMVNECPVSTVNSLKKILEKASRE